MQIGLYYISMRLILNVPAIKRMFEPEEQTEIRIMADFVSIHYVRYMLDAKYGAGAPRRLLTAIYHLRAISAAHPVVAATALRKYEQHLDWLDAELVVFAIFDTELPAEERMAAAKKIFESRAQLEEEFLMDDVRPPGPNFTTSPTFATRPKIATLINRRSLLLWHRMTHKQQDLAWAEQPVETWEQYPKYRELLKFVSGVSVVNDPAERYSAPLHLYNSAPLCLCTTSTTSSVDLRMVKLVSERIGSVRAEDRFQFLLLAVEELTRIRNVFDRAGYNKEELVDAVRRILNIERP